MRAALYYLCERKEDVSFHCFFRAFFLKRCLGVVKKRFNVKHVLFSLPVLIRCANTKPASKICCKGCPV